MPRRAAAALLAVALAACGDGAPALPDAGPPDWPLMEVPSTTTPEAGIRRELFLVPGTTPPPNPVSGDGTPAALNATQVVRYREDVDPPVPAAAVVVAMPGFLGGGPSWDYLARTLVRRGAAAGFAVEVWAIDRRANLLEDLRGLDTAEAAADPEIAAGWYFGVDTLAGERFPGFVAQDAVRFMSEWGLATHVEDLHRVIALVPEAERRARVFLMGHSLGGRFVEAYAGWRFADGSRGADELAGVILVDGVLPPTPITEAEYHDGAGGGFGAVAGVDEIRDGTSYFDLPLLGVSAYAGAEVMSLRFLHAPEAVVADETRDDMLRILLLLGDSAVPRMTNRAVLGFAFDRESSALTFAAIGAGHSTGGAVEPYTNPIFDDELIHPVDPNATYDWVDAREADPPELTPLANIAHSFVDGRSNFAEWYFPARLSIDLLAVAGARVPEDGWQAAEGLRVFDGGLIDAPFLAISTELVSLEDYEAVRARLAPEVGAGRPQAGATRDGAGFVAVHGAGLTHIDPLTGVDVAENPVPAALMDFFAANAAAGSVTIPTF